MKKTFIWVISAIMVLSLAFLGIGCKEPEVIVETVVETVTETVTETVEVEVEAEPEQMEEMQETIEDVDIVDFMADQVGQISSDEWQAVIRPAKEKYVIAMGMFARGLWWYHDLVEAGVQETADDMFVEVFFIDNQVDAQVAIENTRMVIDRGVDFLISEQLFPEANDEMAVLLEEAELPAVGVDVYLPGFPFFHVNDYTGNYMAGDWLANYAVENSWPEEDIDYVYLEQVGGGEVSETRKQAALDGIRNTLDIPDDRYHLIQFEVGSVDVAQENMRTWLTAHPDAKNILVAGTHLYCTLGGLSALREADREDDAAIVGLGGDIAELQELLVEGSAYKAIVSCFPEKYGSVVVPYVVDYLEGKPIPADVVGYNAIITPDNLDRFYDPAELQQ
jgi:ribose transport system substrate-binding protein